MMAKGWLTEAEAYEVAGTLELLAERVERGEITVHFMDVVVRKLAQEKYNAWLARRQKGRQT
jgi:hypothetical protein